MICHHYCMIQIEIFKNSDENILVDDINYFLEQLEEHLFIDIKYSSVIINEDNALYSAIVIYRVNQF